MVHGPAVWRRQSTRKPPTRGGHPTSSHKENKEMANERERALQPEDLTRLFVEFGNAGDAEGLAGLYEADAVGAFPPGKRTVGHAAIRALYAQMLSTTPHFRLEPPLPTIPVGDIALPATPALDEAGAR